MKTQTTVIPARQIYVRDKDEKGRWIVQLYKKEWNRIQVPNGTSTIDLWEGDSTFLYITPSLPYKATKEDVLSFYQSKIDCGEFDRLFEVGLHIETKRAKEAELARKEKYVKDNIVNVSSQFEARDNEAFKSLFTYHMKYNQAMTELNKVKETLAEMQEEINELKGGA